MAFNSFTFLLIFVPLVAAGYWALAPRQTARLIWLTAASLAFYASADWRHLLLLVALTLLGDGAIRALHRSETRQARRWWLGAALAIFLLPLAAFKGFDFAAGTAQSVLALLGVSAEIPLLRLALPLGISFYTFKAISTALDVHNRRIEPLPSALHFLAFVVFFPQLTAGPISRSGDLGRQLAALPARPDPDRLRRGAYLVVLGLAKKVLIADRVAAFTAPLLAAPGGGGLFASWAAALGFTVQLYFDFSGYSDMAAGIGALLGLDLPRNFEQPYRAESIAAFWNRWHVTLSHWFRDYVFNPLSRGLLRRSRGGRAVLIRTTAHLATMALVGLWHGAAWTFVLWGVYHGALLAGFAWLRERRLWPRQAWIGRAITFVLVVIGWAIFASPSPGQAGILLGGMMGLHGVEPLSALRGVIGLRLGGLIAAGLGLAWFAPDSWDVSPSRRAWAGAALGVLLVIALLGMSDSPGFLYRQF